MNGSRGHTWHWTPRAKDRQAEDRWQWWGRLNARERFERMPRRRKLTEAQVRDIRDRPRFIGVGKLLADEYGISSGVISSIRSKKAWKHL